VKRNDVKTDVLIIGGGSAGLIAALEARKYGLDVTVLSKHKVGQSGNIIVSGSALSVVVPEAGNLDSEVTYLEDLYRSGKRINQPQLAETLAQHSKQALELLEGYGLNFFKNKNEFVKRKPPGHSYPRSVPTVWDGYSYMARGLSFTAPLYDAAHVRGVRMINKATVTELIKRDGIIVGAIVFHPLEKEWTVISSKVTIMASGGAGWIFSETNNTVGITGDSYALAYHAGATLIDMEFVQFYPTEMIHLKMPASNPLFGDGAVLRNKFGERFMQKYDPAGDMATRDKMAQAIFMEVESGNGLDGGVYFDCREIPLDILESKYAHFCKQLRKKGVEPAKDMIIVAPTTHYFLGGIQIDQKCRSTLPGLLAAGEATGGIHGANRLSGNAIADTVVFGAIAGNMAAEEVNRARETNLEKENFNLDFYRREEPRYSVVQKKEELRKMMWECASVVRNEAGLRQGLGSLDEIKKSIPYVDVKNEKEFVSFIELQNMLTVSEMIIKGAIERRESRGSHWRNDIPVEHAEYVGNFYYVKETEGCKLYFKRSVL
jgi:succinate dehydrogenase/fumarate reductase flavoprotein subunit